MRKRKNYPKAKGKKVSCKDKPRKLFTWEDSLYELWNNKYDERWNDC